ncbi:MAG: phosphoribosylanthranilate isomerase [Leadbetterella sp.]
MRDPKNILDVAKLNPDYMGFIFYKESSRNAIEVNLDILNSLDGIKKMGVFVNEQQEKIDFWIKQYSLDGVQLHGDEDPELCSYFQSQGVLTWKAISVSDSLPISHMEKYVGKIDAFLLDTKTDSMGGSGKVFDWNILKTYSFDTPFMLAGGLSSDNVDQAIKITQNLPVHGLDLNSKFEDSPGFKNIEKLRQAFLKIRS